MLITLPRVLAVQSRARNVIRQILQEKSSCEGVLEPFNRGGFLFQPNNGGEAVLVIPRTSQMPDDPARVLQTTFDARGDAADLSGGLWRRHPLLENIRATDPPLQIQRILESWVGAFAYVQEDPAREIIGLRPPQIGAVHAVHAHWSVSDALATIVMPTGTGKTETMLSVLVSVGCPRLLVVVPTDALRTQIAEKFLTLGILKSPKSAVLQPRAMYPIVCTLQHIPRTAEEVDDICGRCQVIVTTSSIAGQCEPAVQERMAYHCPYLFIDEAHHAVAPTWSAFKAKFAERRVLQFTATPFREDGKPLDGEIIFTYPLKKAQQEGYFKPIQFSPVIEFNRKRSDEAIATAAVQQLRADTENGHRHILMARVESVARAAQVYELYSRYPEFNPVQIHTGIKSRPQREAIRRQLTSAESRVVVCVDMLGEGFDLPELKIAAFHDIRKTLAVTLQLAGRFTRSRQDLGDATFIANVADIDVQDELRMLYARDPDWNVLLPELSDRRIREQVSLQEFLKGFTQFTEEIPLRTVRPAMSTVVYRTTCDEWRPENFRAGIPGLSSCEQVHASINHTQHTLVVVIAHRVALDWTDVESLFDWEWELLVVIWSPDQHLLFINSSANSGEYKSLARAVAGETATLISGQDVFRAFAGVNRLRLQNVGLSEQLGRNVRYTGRMGADVEPGLTEAQRRNTRKAVLSGVGYEDGQRTTVGASRKGRIWSHRRNRIDQLAIWCRKIGTKLLDHTIDVDELLRGTLDVKIAQVRPAKMPIGIDWPQEIYTSPEVNWSIMMGDTEYALSDLSIELVAASTDGPIRFGIASQTDRVELELELFQDGDVRDFRFVVNGDRPIQVLRRGRREAVDAIDFFYENPPVIWFFDGSSLEGNQLVELRSTYPPYDPGKIEAWTWDGIDLTKESQGDGKEPDSIQARVIRELRTRAYHMIIDDDARGEAADIVAIRLVGEVAAPSLIQVEFYHCKFHTPGQRVKDLYEVCGQAQKSIHWMSSPEKRTDLFTHLLRREASRREAARPSRFEVGSSELLQTIREMSRQCPVSLKIYIVQPGLEKATATRDQLELLSVTENHLLETFGIPFGVIASQ